MWCTSVHCLPSSLMYMPGMYLEKCPWCVDPLTNLHNAVLLMLSVVQRHRAIAKTCSQHCLHGIPGNAFAPSGQALVGLKRPQNAMHWAETVAGLIWVLAVAGPALTCRLVHVSTLQRNSTHVCDWVTAGAGQNGAASISQPYLFVRSAVHDEIAHSLRHQLRHSDVELAARPVVEPEAVVCIAVIRSLQPALHACLLEHRSSGSVALSYAAVVCAARLGCSGRTHGAQCRSPRTCDLRTELKSNAEPGGVPIPALLRSKTKHRSSHAVAREWRPSTHHYIQPIEDPGHDPQQSGIIFDLQLTVHFANCMHGGSLQP